MPQSVYEFHFVRGVLASKPCLYGHGVRVKLVRPEGAAISTHPCAMQIPRWSYSRQNAGMEFVCNLRIPALIKNFEHRLTSYQKNKAPATKRSLEEEVFVKIFFTVRLALISKKILCWGRIARLLRQVANLFWVYPKREFKSRPRRKFTRFARKFLQNDRTPTRILNF